jgi:hypothetical protein
LENRLKHYISSLIFPYLDAPRERPFVFELAARQTRRTKTGRRIIPMVKNISVTSSPRHREKTVTALLDVEIVL